MASLSMGIDVNRTYKTIWNERTGTYVAVGEDCKSRGKAGRSERRRQIVARTILAAAGMLAVPYAVGQTAVSGTTGNNNGGNGKTATVDTNCGTNFVNRQNPGNNPGSSVQYVLQNGCSTAIGNSANAASASVAIGDRSGASDSGIAIGVGAQATKNSAVALGTIALASGNTSFALGRQSAATADYATAIGNVAYANGESGIAMGHSANAAGYRSIAIGAADSRAAGNDGVSGGASYEAASQTRASGTGSVALGAGTTTDVANSVALGSGSVGAANAAGPALFSGDAIAAGGALSIGAAGKERQIKNVAGGTNGTDAVNVNQLRAVADNAVQYDDAGKGSVTLGGTASVDGGVTGGTRITNVHQGDVSANSTDAVNGSQLYATNQKVEQNTTSITNLGDTITNVAGDTSNTYVAQNGRGVKYVRTNDTGLAADDAHATVAGATALGYGATASHAQSVAIGRGSLADGSKLGQAAYAVGGTAAGEVSVGRAGAERRISNVAAGAVDTDAVNVGQLKTVASNVEQVAENAVKYDDAGKGSVTLGGTASVDGGVSGGTRITNVHQGDVSA
ncbi:ESPR-type extended signal peptide-containing protein, partial [Cupriavidus basilensis]